MVGASFQFNGRTLGRLKRGDDHAWQEFFDAFDAAIRSIVAWPKWNFDAHTQSELAQTARSEIVKSFKNLNEPRHISAFVKRICVHRCIDEVRRQVRGRRLIPLLSQDEAGEWHAIDIPTDESFDPVQLIMRRERAEALDHCVGQLDPTCRDSIRGFYMDNLSYKQMAARHSVPINTVGTRLSRCLQKLRALLESSGDGSQGQSPPGDTQGF